MSVPFICVDGVFTVMLNGKSYTLLKDHPNYKNVVNALKKGTADDVLTAINTIPEAAKPKPVVIPQNLKLNEVEIRNGKVYFEGELVHSSIAKRIVAFMEADLPFEPLKKFLARLMQNPSMQSQRELYDFLEHESLPITDDGYFLAYKAVGPNYMDKYRGVFSNRVGEIVSIPRGKVDDDRSKGCSFGLHVGALEYVAGYGNPNAGDHIMVVKVDPADVVSVPTDCNCQKLRTCKYEVLEEYKGELKKPLYSSEAVYDDEEEPEYDEDEIDWDQFYDDEDEDEEEYDDDDECDDRY